VIFPSSVVVKAGDHAAKFDIKTKAVRRRRKSPLPLIAAVIKNQMS